MNQEETKAEKLLILDKVRWARGNRPATKLLDKDGTLCCLGYCMAQEGIPRAVLLDNGEPSEALNAPYRYSGPVPEYMITQDDEDEECGRYSDRILVTDAIDINDDHDTSDEDKVAALNELFQPVGIRVVLVDTPEEVAAMGGIPVDFGNFKFGDAK